MNAASCVFDVFISHASVDKSWVLTLKAALERRGLRVWVDKNEVRPGDLFPEAIVAGISNSRAIVFVISPEALTSKWVNEEYYRALAVSLSPGRQLRLVTVLLRHAKPPDFVGPRQWVDFSAEGDFNSRVDDLYWGLTGEKWRPARRRRDSSVGLSRFYNEIAKRGEICLESRHADVAPYLDDLSQDLRRGLTLIVRPSPQLAASFNSVVDDLNRASGVLFGYDNCRYHFTILSLLTAVDNFQLRTIPTEEYLAIIGDVLTEVPQFAVEFKGVCVASNGIIAKGYPADPGLELIRTKLRRRLRAAGLGQGIDERYKIRGAHVVLARFRQQEDFSRLNSLLKQLRETPLGRMVVRHCQLVVNDFYMSIDKVRVVGEFPELPSHNLPTSPRTFVGREADCGHILGILAKSSSPVILTSGYGGIGKSTLAVEAAHRCLSLGREYFEFIVWIDLRRYYLRQSVTLDFILNTIAAALDPRGSIPAVSELEEKERLVMQLLAKHKTLMVLDNYESVLESANQDNEISGFIKLMSMDPLIGRLVRVVVTTRVLSPGLSHLREHVGVQNIRLQPLEMPAAVELMKDIASKRGITLSGDQYWKAANDLERLPKYMQLAVDQLSILPFHEWETLIKIVPTDLGQDRFFGDLFDLSWNRVLSEDARKLLMAMTYFVGPATFSALSAVTGLAAGRFAEALMEASSAYLERIGDDRYTIHPLTHQACRDFLRRVQNSEFYRTAGRRFVEYFLTAAETSDSIAGLERLQSELRNVVAAVQLARELEEWKLLVRFRPAISGFLRIRGFWSEERQLCESVREASLVLKDFQNLATCLVDDLAWLYLRLEDLDRAEEFAKEGLGYFEQLGDSSGIAQAWRQLGKASLLRGEYDSNVDGGTTSQSHFDAAHQAYQKSIRIREDLHRAGSDQRERIADMKLDFGRLYWLRGRKYELVVRGNASSDPEFLNIASHLYEQAKAVSQEALASFTQLQNVRGIAKAWGNIGNAVKEQARFLIRNGRRDDAALLMREAKYCYTTSLEYAEAIQRKDEIAHAHWGLAEVLEFLSGQNGLHVDARRQLLIEAHSSAEQAHTLYASLGGPYDQRTTRALVGWLELALSAPPASEINQDHHQVQNIFVWLQKQGVRLDEIGSQSAFRQVALGPGFRLAETGPAALATPESRLRVLTLICQKVGATGSGVVVREVAGRLAEYGIEPLVVCAREEDDANESDLWNATIQTRTVLFNKNGHQSLPFPIPGMSDRMPYESIRFLDLDFEQLSMYLDAWRMHVSSVVGSFQPHIIHVHHLWLLAAVCAAVAPHIPIVVSLHGTDLQQARQCSHLASLVAPWTGCYSRLLALTEESLLDASKLYSLPADRAVVMGNGYNGELFRPKRIESSVALAKYGVERLPGEKLILFVGKYVEWKGIEWLVRAFAEWDPGSESSVKLIIGGTGPETERTRYLTMARELGVINRMFMTGAIEYEDVGTLMNIADVFVLPSYHETFGLVLLEAIACGARVISTNQAGPAAFVPRSLLASRDAILISGLSGPNPTKTESERFVRSLSNAIAEQIAKPLSFEKRCEISASVSHLTWDAYVQKVTKMYGQLVSTEDRYV